MYKILKHVQFFCTYTLYFLYMYKIKHDFHVFFCTCTFFFVHEECHDTQPAKTETAFRESLAAVTAQYWPEFVKKVGKPPSYTINGFSGHLKWAHQLENVSHVGLPHETGREAIFVFMTNARNSYTILSKHFKSSHV